MCSECRQHPCHPRCPNADEPKAKYECDMCSRGIYEDDTMYKIYGNVYCEDCINNCRTYA